VDVGERRRQAAEKAAEVHYAKGIEYMESEKFDQAAGEFSRSLGFIPGYKDAQMLWDQARNQANLRAAEENYKRGVAFIDEKKFKEAAIALRTAQTYVPGYKDSQTLYEQAKKEATRRIAIMPFENTSGKPQFNFLEGFITDRILSQAINSNPEFMEFVSRDRLQQILVEQGLSAGGVIDSSKAVEIGKVAGVHAFVFGKVNLVIVNYPPDVETRGSNTIMVTATTTSGRVTQRPASASWVRYKRRGSVAVTASFQIVDARTGAIVKSETLTEESKQEFEWARFSGEEIALPGRSFFRTEAGSVADLASREEGILDPPEVSANRASERLSDKLTARLIEFFR
jgi:TolB-like protein